jgi:hypothetical protein
MKPVARSAKAKCAAKRIAPALPAGLPPSAYTPQDSPLARDMMTDEHRQATRLPLTELSTILPAIPSTGGHARSAGLLRHNANNARCLSNTT